MIEILATAPFNNMRTLKFKTQPTNAFFATVNQIFGGSSQLPTTAERVVIKSLSTIQTTEQCSAVVGSLIDGSEERICQLSFKFWSPHVIKNRSKFTGTNYNAKPVLLIQIIVRDHKRHVTVSCPQVHKSDPGQGDRSNFSRIN